MAEAERVLRELARAGMTREDHVVALGGGVVGDLAGFCAHTYQRGVPVVQVPTTLVAQVDSAYGGKTGVDLPEGKNYAGAYHLPAAVIADTVDPGQPSEEELAAGFVEVLKTGLLAGGELWERVRSIDRLEPEAPRRRRLRLRPLQVRGRRRRRARRRAARACSTSATRSATRSRRRAATARYRHGEAVGLGLLAALRLSEAPELRDEVEAILAPPRAAGRARPGDRRRRGARRPAARQEADRRRASASSCSPSRASPARARSSIRIRSGRPWRSCANDHVPQPRRRPARRQLRRARAARPRGLRRALAQRAGDEDQAAGRASWAWKRSSSRPTPRASSPNTCTGRRSWPTRRWSTPAPGPTTAARSPTRSTSPACPRSRSTSPTSSRARTGARSLGLRRPGAGEGLRQGAGRLPRRARAAGPRARRSTADERPRRSPCGLAGRA